MFSSLSLSLFHQTSLGRNSNNWDRCGKNSWYKLVTGICGIPVACYWGCVFAVASFIQVWICTPIVRLNSIVCNLCLFLNIVFQSVFCVPLHDAIGHYFKRIHVTTSSGALPKPLAIEKAFTSDYMKAGKGYLAPLFQTNTYGTTRPYEAAKQYSPRQNEYNYNASPRYDASPPTNQRTYDTQTPRQQPYQQPLPPVQQQQQQPRYYDVNNNYYNNQPPRPQPYQQQQQSPRTTPRDVNYRESMQPPPRRYQAPVANRQPPAQSYRQQPLQSNRQPQTTYRAPQQPPNAGNYTNRSTNSYNNNIPNYNAGRNYNTNVNNAASRSNEYPRRWKN